MIPFKYNVRNLMVRWKTTALTAIGFILIVALLVVMLGFVRGIKMLAARSGPDSNVILLREGVNDELFSDIPRSEPLFKLWTSQPEVVEEDGTPLASQEIYSVATQEVPPEEEGGRPTYRFLQVRGVSDPAVAGRVHALRVKEGGRWFDPSGAEVVMGEGIARVLGLRVGDEFQIRPLLRWKLVGVLDSRGSPFDSEIWAKLDDVGRYFGKDNVERGQRFFTSIVVHTHSAADAQKYTRTIKDRTQLEVSGMLETKYYEEMSEGTQMFLFAAVFIAAVMAIGGMCGLMNTMFAAVSQRIKDIGVLRVLGFSRTQILISFLLESLILALFGGLLGIALGYLFNGVEQTGVMSRGRGPSKTVVFSIAVDQWVLLTALGFSLAMGFLGGLLPALSAMRIKLLDSLR